MQKKHTQAGRDKITLDQEIFEALVASPPDGAIAATIPVAMARWLLATVNTFNRRMRRTRVARLADEMKNGTFQETGDTIKFSSDGVLLDGQHRLQACVEAQVPISSLLAFGIDKGVMPVIDIGAARSGGDALSVYGIGSNAPLIAGAVRAAVAIERQSFNVRPSNADTLDLATGRMAEIVDWLSLALRMRRGKGIAPSLTAALAYQIAQVDPAAAEQFFHEWMHGLREGRNAGFTVLETRLAHAKQDGLSRRAVLALIITTFNKWYTGEAVKKQSLTWRETSLLPALFSAEKVENETRSDNWSAADLTRLAEMMRQKVKWKLIAKELNRSVDACVKRGKRMKAPVEIESQAPARRWPT